MTLGEQIKQARERKNLSQEELAEYIGVSRQAISKWENDTAMPQGANRELLSKILEFDMEISTTETVSKKGMPVAWLGWAIAILLLIVVIVLSVRQVTDEQNFPVETSEEDYASAESAEVGLSEEVTNETTVVTPAIKTIHFYDDNQAEVTAEALWYNAAQIDSILIQWEGDSPNSIKMLFTPSGSNMLEATELLLTEPVLDGDTVALLSADVLTDITQGHLYFLLDFGQNAVASDEFNVFYDSELLGE